MVEISVPRLGVQGRLEPQKSDRTQPLPDHPELLAALGRTEATSIRHLERSNKELVAALEVCEDSDFRTALEENAKILKAKYARLTEISAKLGSEASLHNQLDCTEDECTGHWNSSGASISSMSLEFGLEVCPYAAAPSSSSHDVTDAVAQLGTLLQRVKRKAFELEDASAAVACAPSKDSTSTSMSCLESTTMDSTSLAANSYKVPRDRKSVV